MTMALLFLDPTTFSTTTTTELMVPILIGAEYLVPTAVAIAGAHKVMEHRETAFGYVMELLTKGGGAILAIELIKGFAGVG